jgi:hypothetical protein
VAFEDLIEIHPRAINMRQPESALTYKTPSECGHKLILRVSFITGTQNNSTYNMYVAFVLPLRGGIIIEGASVADFADEQKNSTTLPQMLRCTPHPTIEMILLQRWGDNLMASLSPIQTRTFPSAE